MTVSTRRLQIAGLILLGAAILSLLIIAGPLGAHDSGTEPHQGHPPLHAQDIMRAFNRDHQQAAALPALSATSCLGGFAGSFPCDNVDLLAFLPLNQIGGGNGNDIWGWTDPLDGAEYAIMGRTNGTSFVDISDPVNPIYLGNLPPHISNSSWRDIKVYNNHAFIVSEAFNSGIQVFDLTQLRNVASPGGIFSETAHYNGFGSAHNLVINEDSGYAFAVGANNCSGGLHMVDISNPTSPTSAGCYSGDGYTHDAQCVNYSGPDTDHQGKEICFNSNEDTLTIVDVTNKPAPTLLSRTSYEMVHYAHQGWLTEDQKYFLLDDELDEQNHGFHTRTGIWDVSDLDNPINTDFYFGTTNAIDHNQYILGDYSYQANYRSGLRILDISDVANDNLSEVAYFDIYPSSDAAQFNGAWSNYPYFESGVVVVSGIEQGLFVLQPNLNISQTKPNVNIASPAGGSTLFEALTIQIAATDGQDAAGTLNVEWKIDGGVWQPAAYNGSSGYYEAAWDVTQESLGSHILYARATDSDSESDSDSINVNVANGPQEFHIQNILLAAVHDKGPRYIGQATVIMVDTGGLPVEGVTVNGTFLIDWEGTASGTTGSDGQAIITTPAIKNGANWLFCVDSAAKSGWTYDFSANVKRCGGTTAIGEIDGRVTDDATGLGLEGVVVSTDSGQSANTDENGDYILSNVPVGSREVTAAMGGYIAQQKPAAVNEDSTTTVNFTLIEESTGGGGSGSIKGTVISGGSRLRDVTVTTDSGHMASTNNGGKYTIQNVPEGSHTVTASKSGYLDKTLNIVVIAGGTVTLNFDLTPAP